MGATIKSKLTEVTVHLNRFYFCFFRVSRLTEKTFFDFL